MGTAMSTSAYLLLTSVNPSCRQTTMASAASQLSSKHMLVQTPPRHTSTRPTLGFPVSFSRTSPLAQLKLPTAGEGRKEAEEGREEAGKVKWRAGREARGGRGKEGD